MNYATKQGDALQLLSEIEPGSIDAVITDPPYYKVLKESWDKQWKGEDDFIAWLDEFFALARKSLAPNGSLYCFAWPKVAARVEIALSKHFTVLNHIVWDKGRAARIAKANKESLTRYFINSERILFCEQKDTARDAVVEDDGSFLYEPIRSYLASGWAERSPEEADRVLGTKIAAQGHYFGKGVFFRMPTKENYQKLQRAVGEQFYPKSYELLRQEYLALQSRHTQKKRFFSVNEDIPHSDVWRFSPVAGGTALHPAQKPLALMEHMISVSTRPGDRVLDPFMGSGTTGVAALNLGRRFIGFEREPEYFATAQERLDGTANEQQVP